MRLDFKRFLSGVLALVMMTSALTMVNVSSVMAAVNTDKWMASETLPTGGWLAFTKGFSYNAQYSSNKEETFVDGTFDSGDGNEDSPQKQPYYGPAAVGSTFTITTKGNAELDIYAVVNNSGDATLSVSGADEGNATTGDNTIHQKGTKGIKPIHYQLKGADTYTFTTATKKDVCIFRIDLITSDGGEEETGYTWTLDDSKLKAANMDTVASNLKFNNSTITDKNILTLDNTEDTGYSLLPGVKTLYKGLTDLEGVEIVTVDSADETGKTFKITPTPAMFMEHVTLDLDDIAITGGANRVLHLTCETHKTTYSILLGDAEDTAPAHAYKMLVSKDEYGGYELSDEIAIPVHNDVYKATMGGGHLDKDTFTLSKENKKIEATYTQHDRTAITDTVSGINFTKLRTTSEAAAERLMGGTVVGTVGDSEDINYMRVVGEGYQNVYALSGTAEEHGNFAKAITIRSIGDDMAETGAVAGGGLGFSIGTDDAVGGADTRFKVTVSAVAIKDRKSPGVDSKLGLAKIASDEATGSEKVGEHIADITINGIEDNTDFETKNNYTFETELEPGEDYVLYNYGNVTEEGNIRIYSVSFEKTKSGTSTPGTVVFKDSYNPTGSSITDITDVIYLDNTRKFKANASTDKKMSIDQSGKSNIDLANGEKLEPAKGRFKTGGSGSAVDEAIGRNIVFETEEAGDVYVYAAASSTPDANKPRYLVLSDGSSAQNGEHLSDSSYNVDKFTVEANKKYYLYSGNSGINIFYIGSTAALKAAELKTQNVTFTATNNTSSPVIVTITDGKTFEVAANAKAQTYTVEAVPEGKYKLSAPGCTITGADITVSADSKEFTITIDESKNVNVTFGMSDSTKPDDNITITPADGKAQIISKNNGTPVTFSDVAPGTVFTIEGTPSNVWKWVAKSETATDDGTYSWDKYKESRKYITYDITGKKFTYTLPDAENIVTGDDNKYGVTFTASASSNMATAAGSQTNLFVNTGANDMPFGQYGFGDDKAIENCGGSWARSGVNNYVNFVSTPLSMKDYTSGHYARYYNSLTTDAKGRTNRITKTKEVDNQFIVLSQETVTDATNAKNYIEFKVADSVTSLDGSQITVQIDRDNGVDLYDKAASTVKITPSAYIANSEGEKITKQEFPVTAGHTYRIVANGKTYEGTLEKNKPYDSIPSGSEKNATGPVMVKSIRIFNPNNIFDGFKDSEIDAIEIEGGKTKIEEDDVLAEVVKAATDNYEAIPENYKIFRVIGELNLEGINGIGSNPTKDELAAAVSNIGSVGYDVYDKAEYDTATANTTSGYLYHAGLDTSNHNPNLIETITIDDVVNSAYDLDSDDGAVTDGVIGDEGLSAKVFTQVFYATNKNVVLVPWVQYNLSNSKVYSLIQRDDDAKNNNKELNGAATE